MKNLITKITTIVMAIAIIVTTVNPMEAVAASKKAALNKKSATLTITNEKKAPAVTLKVKNTKVKKVKWTTSNKNVASIKATGKYSVKITAKKAGTANIICRVNGKKLVCRIVVKEERKTNNETDNSNANDKTDNNNTNDKTDNNPSTKTPECEHEWAEQWTVYEHEGDYGPDACPCHCGVFDSTDELDYHLFKIKVSSGVLNYMNMMKETGIHGSKAKCTGSVSTVNGITHITIKTEYIEYYYCTKCDEKIGATWDTPKKD